MGLQNIFCPACGHALSAESAFCANCGASVGRAAAVFVTPQPATLGCKVEDLFETVYDEDDENAKL